MTPAASGFLDRLGADLSAANSRGEAVEWALRELHMAAEARRCRVDIRVLRLPYPSPLSYRVTVSHADVVIAEHDVALVGLSHAIDRLLEAFR
jgi:hypothetical protein